MLYIKKDSDSFLKKIFQIGRNIFVFTIIIYIICFWLFHGIFYGISRSLTYSNEYSLFYEFILSPVNIPIFLFFWGSISIYFCILIYAAFKYKNISFFKVRPSYIILVLLWVVLLGTILVLIRRKLKDLNFIGKEIDIILVVGVLILVCKKIYPLIQYLYVIREHYKNDLDEGEKIQNLYYSEAKKKNIHSIEKAFSDRVPTDVYDVQHTTRYLVGPGLKNMKLYMVIYYVGYRNIYDEVYEPQLDVIPEVVERKKRRANLVDQEKREERKQN